MPPKTPGKGGGKDRGVRRASAVTGRPGRKPFKALSISSSEEEAPEPEAVEEKAPTPVATPVEERPVDTYTGPRPDENLLQATRLEAQAGQEASVEALNLLVVAGEEVNQRSLSGYTPLALASAAGNGALVSLLLERDADVSIGSLHRSELPLHLAAVGGHSVVCKLLGEPTFSAGCIDAPNICGWPALHLAVMGNHISAASTLLRSRATVDSRNSVLGGLAALHLAVRLGFAEMTECLLDREATADLVDFAGRSPLHYAASRCDSACASLLVRSRANPGRRGHDGLSPLDLVPDGNPGSAKVAALLRAYAHTKPYEEERPDSLFVDVEL